uniref:Uncharacterized protein n=1 Tax=Eutreptiella gymnastica TaxID=73025 RepID=A0A7S1NKZ7_9EUGL|mmetsp:Transcript_46370/g.82884  ORF Transcript_46370/g.82884 Transcript_46370/m.82884 type:complete len:146 (+) Transcript_46370:441-878(+)
MRLGLPRPLPEFHPEPRGAVPSSFRALHLVLPRSDPHRRCSTFLPGIPDLTVSSSGCRVPNTGPSTLSTCRAQSARVRGWGCRAVPLQPPKLEVAVGGSHVRSSVQAALHPSANVLHAPSSGCASVLETHPALATRVAGEALHVR